MMSIAEKILTAQRLLKERNIDGWLMYDCCRSNIMAWDFLNIPPGQLLTRRFFFWIPKEGEAVKLVHRIERPIFAHLPALEVSFATWKELELALADIVKNKKIAMEYSPRNALPSLSKVDAGTIELVRSFEATVVSSQDLLQQFTSILTPQQVESHLRAAKILDHIVSDAWQYIAEALRKRQSLCEWDVQQFILQRFKEEQCIANGGPICAINANSADPHYEPKEHGSAVIKKGDWILLDLWCKLNVPDAVYADITRVGVAAALATERQEEIFAIVKDARNSATDCVRSHFAQNIPLCGWQVDKVCRDVIIEKGYGDSFLHRTGHSIDVNDHGSGANIDDFETHDDRRILPGTCFSIEPGLYFPGEFGVRLEYDVYVDKIGGVHVTGGQQEEITTLMIGE
jgi:Xaa-Pro dipeptidase